VSKAVDELAEEVTDRAESEHDEGDMTDDSSGPCCNGHGFHGFYRRDCERISSPLLFSSL